jgi:hypothetical protein
VRIELLPQVEGPEAQRHPWLEQIARLEIRDLQLAGDAAPGLRHHLGQPKRPG